MIHSNDRILKDMNIVTFKEFGVKGLVDVIADLQERIEKLESKPKIGRPRKVVNG